MVTSMPELKIGPVLDVPYLQSGHTSAPGYRDVCIVSSTGDKYGFNKLLLASVSALFRDLLLEHFSNLNNSSEDKVCFSTNFTSTSIVSLHQLCHYGQMLVSQGHPQPSLKDFGVQEMASTQYTDGSMVKMEDPSMTEKEFFGNDYHPHQVSSAYSMDAFHQANLLKPNKQLDFEFEAGFDTGFEDFQYHLAVEDGEEAYTKNEDEKMEIKLEEECQGEVVSNLTQKSLTFLKKLAAQHGDLQAKGKTALCHTLLEHFRLVHGADQALANQSRPKRKYTKRDVTRKISKPEKSKASVDENPQTYFYFPSLSEVPRDFSSMWQCSRCSRGFSSLPSYRQHFRRHEIGNDSSRAFICLRCMKFEGATRKEVRLHVESDCPVDRHSDGDSIFTYYCALCEQEGILGTGQSFNTSAELQHHFKTEHINNKDNPEGGGAKGGSTPGSSLPTVACSSCGQEFPSGNSQYLRKHLYDQGPYHREGRCWACPQKFDSWSAMQDHIHSEHDGVFKYLCGFCNINVFPTKEELKHHRLFCKLVTATSEVLQVDGQETACTVCGELCMTSGHAVKQHLIDYHSGMALKCEFCQMPFFKEQALKDHVQSVHMNKKFDCTMCDKSFSQKAQLKKHEAVHGEPKHICDVCGKKFHQPEILRQHVNMTHDADYRAKSDAKTQVCDICGWEGAKRNYNQHFKYKHLNDQKTCSECGEQFPGKIQLNKHIRTKHTFEQCSVCGLSISYVYLRRHMLLKHSDSSALPFQCTICNKGFLGKMKFKNHMNIHTGERPYSCRFCERTFGDNANCIKHMRESHSEQWLAYKASKKKMAEMRNTIQRVHTA